MTRRVVLFVVGLMLLGVVGSAVGGASGSGIKVAATLSADQVRFGTPAGPVGSARGTFSEVVDVANALAVWKLTYSGTTGQVTDAQVDYFDRSDPKQVVGTHVGLCHPCAKAVTGVDHWPSPAYARSFLAAVRRGEAYVTLNTAKNPKYGEIAGKLKVVGTSTMPAPPKTSLVAVTASASYAAGKLTLGVVSSQKGTATVVVSNRGKTPYTSQPITIRAGSQTIVLVHTFDRGFHSGFVNIVFAASTRTVSIGFTAR